MSSQMTVEKYNDIRKTKTGSKNVQTFQLFPDLEKDFSCKSSMSTDTPNTFLPGTPGQRGGGGEPRAGCLRPRKPSRFLRLAQKVARQALADTECLEFPRLLRVPRASEGPVPGGGKEATSGKEPEEPPRQKLPKAHTVYTHSDTPLPWKPSQSPKPSSGKSGPTLSGQGTRPGENQDWGPGVLSRARPGPRSPRRLPSKGAAQRRDWWSRRRNMS